jgi:hypothetical protein
LEFAQMMSDKMNLSPNLDHLLKIAHLPEALKND